MPDITKNNEIKIDPEVLNDELAVVENLIASTNANQKLSEIIDVLSYSSGENVTKLEAIRLELQSIIENIEILYSNTKMFMTYTYGEFITIEEEYSSNILKSERMTE